MSVAELSIICSSSVAVLVGFGTPWVAAHFAERAQQRASQEAREAAGRAAKDARVDELRAVVDDAAKAAMEAMRAIPSPRDLPDRPTDPIFRERMVLVTDSLMLLWAAEARIAARVGTKDELYLSLTAASNTIGRLATAYRKWEDGADKEEALRAAATVFIDEIPHSLGAFFEIAARRIGPDRATIQ